MRALYYLYLILQCKSRDTNIPTPNLLFLRDTKATDALLDIQVCRVVL